MEGRVSTVIGDCMEVLPTLPAACYSAMITDPPYGIGFQTGDWDKIANDERPFIWFLQHAYRVIKDPGVLICFCRWDVAEAFRTGIELAGFKITSQLVWDRGYWGQGDVQAAAAPRHELAWMATKGRWKFPGKRISSVLSHMRAAPGDLMHPTEKPLGLMNELVRMLTAPGDAVIDPFMGVGAVGVACKLNGRSFTGIELERKYALIAQARIDQAAGLFTGDDQ